MTRQLGVSDEHDQQRYRRPQLDFESAVANTAMVEKLMSCKCMALAILGRFRIRTILPPAVGCLRLGSLAGRCNSSANSSVRVP